MCCIVYFLLLDPSLYNKMVSKDFLNKKIELVYFDDLVIKGTCLSIDGYLNTVLKDVTVGEGVNLKSCFVRGIKIKHIGIKQ